MIILKPGKLNIALSIVLSLGLIQSSSVFAQDVKELSDIEKRNVELDLAIKETALKKAEQDLLKGSFLTPGDASKAPSGETSADEVKIEGTTLAYEALGEVSSRIQQDLSELSPSLKYLIIADKDGNSKKLLEQYQAYHNQLALFKKGFKKILGESSDPLSPQPQFNAISSANLSLRGIIETVALFRTETTLKGISVSIDEQDFVAQLAAQFRKNNNIISTPTPPGSPISLNSSSCIQALGSEVEIYYPTLYSLDITSVGNISPCQLKVLENIDELTDYHSKAKFKLGRLTRGKSVDKALKDSSIPESDKTLISEINDLNTQFQSFKSALFKAQASGTTPLSILANATRFGEMMSSGKGYLMLVNIKSGGTNRITRNILTSKIRYSGAAIVSYIVYDSRGLIRLSDNLYHHTGFQKFSRDTTAAVSEAGNATLQAD